MIMIDRGGADEALARVRPDPAELDDGHVCSRHAELLATAVEVLRAARASGRPRPGDFPEEYAQLLARQGLIDELGALAAEDHRSALDVYAKAFDAVPTIAESRAAAERREREREREAAERREQDDPWAAADGFSVEPPFQPGRRSRTSAGRVIGTGRGRPRRRRPGV